MLNLSRVVGHAPFDILLRFWVTGLAINLRTKFEVSNFTSSRDIERVPKCRSRSHDLNHAPFHPQI